jgi:hypothetical protein
LAIIQREQRIVAATLVGLAAGGLALWLRLSGRTNFSDFHPIWFAAQAVLHHRDPYKAVAHNFIAPFYYPLPAAIVGLPFALLPLSFAGPVFVAIGFALLAYALTARAWWPLIALASYPALDAARLCQWSPIFAAAALLPWLGWLAAVKPTTGIVTVGSYFSRRWLAFNVAAACVVVAIAFACWPSWIGEWLRALRGAHHFVPMMFRPGGALLLLALIRWRRPEARMLALMAIVPQTGVAYDALPLVLVPSSRRQALAFGFLSFAAIPFILPQEGQSEAWVRALAHNQTVYLAALYLPALVAVLARPNTAQPHHGREHPPVRGQSRGPDDAATPG